ncbi:MAG TPA: alpha/beta hydrolase, partial [Patescibacteria group bacterium]|nr:alpha/beta hydrolase [Patescibacteria group bacterium]
PAELKHETPILFIPGYGDGDPMGRKANIFELYKAGRRVITVKTLHGVPLPKPKEPDPTHPLGLDFTVEEMGNPEDYEKAVEISNVAESLQRQVNTILPVLEKKNLEHVALLGESRGGAVATILAYEYPEKFDVMSLVDPVGFSGEVSALKLMYLFGQTGVKEGREASARDKAGQVSPMAREQMVWGSTQFLKFVLNLKNFETSRKETVDMAHSEVFQMLNGIKEHDIGISIVHGVDDPVFPMEGVQNNISNEVAKHGLENIIDGFYSVAGAHGAFATQPEIYTPIVEGAITALENKKLNKMKEKPE